MASTPQPATSVATEALIPQSSIITGEYSIESMGKIVLKAAIGVVSGHESKAMQLKEYDFIPWKRDSSL